MPADWVPDPHEPTRRGLAATVLVALTPLAGLFLTTSQQVRYDVVVAATAILADRPAPEVDVKYLLDPDSVESRLTAAHLLHWGCLAVAGLLVMRWLWGLRTDVERLTQRPHRYPRSWVVGGWLCPVLNLWVPAKVINDVRHACDQHEAARSPWLIRLWWASWLVLICALLVAAVSGLGPRVVGRYAFQTVLYMGVTAVELITAALVIAVIWRVNRQVKPVLLAAQPR